MIDMTRVQTSRQCIGARSTARRATSLIELLVVIFIIALLIGMLVPSLKRSMNLARSTVCMHNMREIGQCLYAYRTDFDGWLPVSPPPSQVARATSEVWFQKLWPAYMPDARVLACPEDPFRFRMLRASHDIDHPEVVDYPSYGINSFIMAGGRGALANLDRYRPSRPADTILLGDLGPDRETPGTAVDVVDEGDTNTKVHMQGPRRNSGRLPVDDGYDPVEADVLPWLTLRHGHGINVLTLAHNMRQARTIDHFRNPPARHYDDCANGGCTMCNELQYFHYSFAKDRLYWWTGSAPEVATSGSGL